MLARVFGDGEPPTWWGIPVLRVGGCELRIHLVAVVFVLSMLLYAVWTGPGLWFVSTGLLALALLVALHEAARAHALVRWRGRQPIDATLWPLGAVWRFGEATPTDERVGALTGLAMLAAVAIGAGAAVWAGPAGAEALRFDPRHPSETLGPMFASRSTARTLGVVFIWQCYATSLYVLAANLIPMLPLDAALLLRRARKGAGPDHLAAAGLGVAVVLAVGGLLLGQALVAFVGVCGGSVCWSTWQSSRFALDPAGADRWRAALAGAPESAEAPGPPRPMSAEDQGNLELVLQKISATGMESLSRSERRILKDATRRMRDG
ncbi:MAG: hypothetical protein IPJ41_11900 [Phycisphaerales bacterium]|nr:hypothetical protein [Phycisphaerales bacterium]